jgi:hypothetical protein
MIAIRKTLSVLAAGLIAALSVPVQAKISANKLASNKLASNALSVAAGEGAVVDVLAVELPDGTRLQR